MSRMLSARAPLLPVATLLCLISTVDVRAQPVGRSANSQWELNLHAAALRPGLFDESVAAPQFGARLVRNFASGLSFGANVDWARPEDITLPLLEGVSASLLMYSAEIGYRIRASPRTEFFLGAGAGAATLALDQVPIGVAEKSTGLLVPVGAGIKVLNRAVSPAWALRVDVRDNVILLETLVPDGSVETEPRHNVEASVGLSLMFGGGDEEAVAVDRDTDRDGVPDPLDYCLNRPGQPVDARGCPLRPEPAPTLEPGPPGPVAEADADLDGVPDSRDGCLGTGADTPVKADGCPVLPPMPVPPPGDSDGDGVDDDMDACPGTPIGIVVDERGCLAPPAQQEEPPAAEEGEPAAVERPDPGIACLDSSEERALEFDGRRFRSAGYPQTVDRAFLVRAGTAEGLPIFVSDTAKPPYPDFWVPRCGAEDLFDLYVEAAPVP